MFWCRLSGIQWRHLQRVTFSCLDIAASRCVIRTSQDEPSTTLRLCPHLPNESGGSWTDTGSGRPRDGYCWASLGGDSGPWSEPGREKTGWGRGPAAIRVSCIWIQFKGDVERGGTWVTPRVSPEERAGLARVPFSFMGPRSAGHARGTYSRVLEEKWWRNNSYVLRYITSQLTPANSAVQCRARGPGRCPSAVDRRHVAQTGPDPNGPISVPRAGSAARALPPGPSLRSGGRDPTPQGLVTRPGVLLSPESLRTLSLKLHRGH